MLLSPILLTIFALTAVDQGAAGREIVRDIKLKAIDDTPTLADVVGNELLVVLGKELEDYFFSTAAKGKIKGQLEYNVGDGTYNFLQNPKRDEQLLGANPNDIATASLVPASGTSVVDPEFTGGIKAKLDLLRVPAPIGTRLDVFPVKEADTKLYKQSYLYKPIHVLSVGDVTEPLGINPALQPMPQPMPRPTPPLTHLQSQYRERKDNRYT